MLGYPRINYHIEVQMTFFTEKMKLNLIKHTERVSSLLRSKTLNKDQLHRPKMIKHTGHYIHDVNLLNKEERDESYDENLYEVLEDYVKDDRGSYTALQELTDTLIGLKN